MTKREIVLVDTNVLLRLLIGDIESQLEQAKVLFGAVERREVVAEISVLVVNELIWILENYYEKTRAEFIGPVLTLFSLKNVKMPDADKKLVMKVLRAMLKQSLDFTDLYLWKLKTDEKELRSFDKKLLKLIK